MQRKEIYSTWNTLKKVGISCTREDLLWRTVRVLCPHWKLNKKWNKRKKEELSPTRKRPFLADVAHFPSFEKADVIFQQLPENGIVCAADSLLFSLSKYLLKKFFSFWCDHNVRCKSFVPKRKRKKCAALQMFFLRSAFYSILALSFSSNLFSFFSFTEGLEKPVFPFPYIWDKCVSV